MDFAAMFGMIAVDLAIWFLGAIIVVGLIQTAKNALPARVVLPGWAWAFIMLAVSIGVGFARSAFGGPQAQSGPLWVGLGIAAVSQICYESIYKGILKRGAKFADGEPGASGQGK
jgi:hypothetical protein